MPVVGQTALNYCWDNGNRLAGVSQQPCPNNPSVRIAYDNANRRSCLTFPTA